MKTGIRIHPHLRYDALLCGLRGDTITMPGEAILNISAPGDARRAVAAWLPDITRPKTLTADRLRAILRETGAWEEEALEGDAENWDRAIWIAACNASESANEGDVSICEPENEDEEQALVEAFMWTEDGQDLVGEVATLVSDRIGEDMNDDEFEELFETGEWADRKEVWSALNEAPVAGEFDKWVEARISDLVSDYTARTHKGYFFISGSEVEPKTGAIAALIDLGHEKLKPIIYKAAREAFKARRKRDIGRLCQYMGLPYSVQAKAVELDLDRVPKILELAGR